MWYNLYMRVHFSASTESIATDIHIYRYICEAIRSSGGNLARDWIEEAYENRDSRYSKKQAAEIARHTQHSIADCDITILEATRQSFGLGYQAALASSMQKPLLILQRTGSRPLGAIGVGTASILRSHEVYSSKRDLGQIISVFMQTNNISTKDLRFNMMLERDLFYYLNNESSMTGIPKSQIVRSLIRRAAHEKNHLRENT